jgi:plastocyanin
MTARLTVTFGVCLAAGLAAGIGLARPGTGGSSPPPVDGADAVAPASSGSGYGSPAPAAASPAPAAPSPVTVTIVDFAFDGAALAGPGAAVEVVNADGTDHTLTAEDRSFDTGNLASGARATLTAPSALGSYRFFCAIHPSMQGTLEVQA